MLRFAVTPSNVTVPITAFRVMECGAGRLGLSNNDRRPVSKLSLSRDADASLPDSL